MRVPRRPDICAILDNPSDHHHHYDGTCSQSDVDIFGRPGEHLIGHSILDDDDDDDNDNNDNNDNNDDAAARSGVLRHSSADRCNARSPNAALMA